MRVAALVRQLLAIDNSLAHPFSATSEDTVRIQGAVEIVVIELNSKSLHLQPSLLANLGSYFRVLSVVDDTFIVVPSLPQCHWDDVEVVGGVSVCGVSVIGPVCYAISDQEACQIDAFNSGVELRLQVTLVDLPSQVWNVDASITLTR